MADPIDRVDGGQAEEKENLIMTNIDHDALARRIAVDLNNASKLSRSSYWFMEDAALYIAATLREALPTSEETSLTPDQVERARKLVKRCDGYVKNNCKLTALEACVVELLREVVGDE